jgi:hypothetical protein
VTAALISFNDHLLAIKLHGSSLFDATFNARTSSQEQVDCKLISGATLGCDSAVFNSLFQKIFVDYDFLTI